MAKQHLEVVANTPPPVWAGLRNEAERAAREEPALASLLNTVILSHDHLADALSFQLARKLGDHELSAMSFREIADEAFAADPALVAAAEADLKAVLERDPASKGYVQPFLFFKGFLALQTHRVAHWLWTHSRQTLALHLQSQASQVFAVDVHPAARIGEGTTVGPGAVIGADVRIGQRCRIGASVVIDGWTEAIWSALSVMAVSSALTTSGGVFSSATRCAPSVTVSMS